MLIHADRAQRDSAPLAQPAGARLAFLDGLRGLAALAVFICHSVQVAFAYYYPPFRWFDIGQFGVALFFLCSGFIIPISLERAQPSSGAIRSFWVRRICRLYPLYWFSLALVLAAGAAGWTQRSPYIADLSALTIVANLTMLQILFGYPHLLVVYWTLFFELLFYGLVTLLFALGAHRQTVRHTIGLLLTALATQLLLPLTIGLRFPISFLIYFAMMFVGTALCRYHHRAISGRTTRLILLLTLLTLLVSAWSAPAVLAARVAALAVFGAALRLSRRRQPWSLLYLGRISYSFYLLHPLVLIAIPPLPSYVASALVWLAATLLLSTATYRWIEQPGIALGRRLTQLRHDRAPHELPQTT
jgi:peptidoglycan/LPS O-acetylase OafA/YrhL